MARRGKPRKYPWEIWFGRPFTLLRAGVDYHISQSMMFQSIKNKASQCRLKVRVRDIGSGMTIEVIGGMDGVPHFDQTTLAAKHSNELASYGSAEEETAQGNKASYERSANTSTTALGHNNTQWSGKVRRRQLAGSVQVRS